MLDTYNKKSIFLKIFHFLKGQSNSNSSEKTFFCRILESFYDVYKFRSLKQKNGEGKT